MKKRHQDVDASWAKKRNEVHYRYKGYFLESAVSKLIVQVFPTTARVHDAKVIDQYLGWAKSCKKEVLFFADVDYTGKKIAEKLLDADMPPNICEKGRKDAPLTEEQKQSNKTISSIRSRIEHAFGFIEELLGSSVVRAVGMIRTKFNIAVGIAGVQLLLTWPDYSRDSKISQGNWRSRIAGNVVWNVTARIEQEKVEQAQYAESRRSSGAICYRSNGKLIANKINCQLCCCL